MAVMPNALAENTVKNYRCSRCWNYLVKTWVADKDGQLTKTEAGEQLANVKCRICNEDFGFVSNYFIENERVKDFGYGFEVTRDLIRMEIITKEKAHVG